MNNLVLGAPLTISDSTPFVTARHGLGVIPDSVTLAVLGHSSVAAPTFVQVAADANTVTWQWTNPEAGKNATVQASATVSRALNSGEGSSQMVASATLALTPASGGVPACEAIYQQTVAQSVDGGDNIINFNSKITDTANAVTVGAAWKFTAPADGTYLVTARHGFYINGASAGTVFEVETRLYKNDTFVGTLAPPCGGTTNGQGVGETVGQAGAMQVRLVAGDYIDLRLHGVNSVAANFNTNGGFPMRTQIEIQRVR